MIPCLTLSRHNDDDLTDSINVTAHINDIGDDALRTIFEYLFSYGNLESVSTVCRRWRRLVLEVVRQHNSRLQQLFLFIESNKPSVRFNRYPVRYRCLEEQGIEFVHGDDLLTYPRKHAAMCQHGSKVYMFGGEAHQGNGILNDLLYYSLKTCKWTRVICKNSSPPGKLDGHLFAINADTLLLFGGSCAPDVALASDNDLNILPSSTHNSYDAACECTDVYLYSEQTCQWEFRPSFGLPPNMVSILQLRPVYCPYNKFLIVLGTKSVNEHFEELGVDDWVRNFHRGRVRIWRYDLNTGIWETQATNGENLCRYFHHGNISLIPYSTEELIAVVDPDVTEARHLQEIAEDATVHRLYFRLNYEDFVWTNIDCEKTDLDEVDHPGRHEMLVFNTVIPTPLYASTVVDSDSTTTTTIITETNCQSSTNKASTTTCKCYLNVIMWTAKSPDIRTELKIRIVRLEEKQSTTLKGISHRAATFKGSTTAEIVDRWSRNSFALWQSQLAVMSRSSGWTPFVYVDPWKTTVVVLCRFQQSDVGPTWSGGIRQKFRTGEYFTEHLDIRLRAISNYDRELSLEHHSSA